LIGLLIIFQQYKSEMVISRVFLDAMNSNHHF